MAVQKVKKVDLEGTPHVFDEMSVEGNKTVYKCRVCEIEGYQTGNHKFIEVPVIRKTKKFIESCKKPVTQGEKKIVYKLPVEYTIEEIKDFQKQMVTEYFNIESVDREKASADSDFKAKIKASEEIIHNCMKAVRDGKEELEVECTVKYHCPEDFMKQIIRDDTNEIILEDKMDDDDCTFLNQLESGINETDGIANEN